MLYSRNDTPPDTLIIYCSDPRFRKATEDFINSELKPQNYAPIVVPGSIGHLVHQVILPKNFKFIKEQIELLLSHNAAHIKKIVLINHQDCRGYDALYSKIRQIMEKAHIVEAQKDDLKLVAQIIEKLLRPRINFEMYYASDAKGVVSFEKIS